MHPHTAPLGPGALLVAEITSGGVGGALWHSIATVPPWLGGALSALPRRATREARGRRRPARREGGRMSNAALLDAVADVRAAYACVREESRSLGDAARTIRSRLDGVATRGRLNREVIIADDDRGGAGTVTAVLSTIVYTVLQ